MAKTPAQSAAKWDASTSLGTDVWATNLNQTQKPIVAAAIAARPQMQANFNAATAPGGVWERNLSARGDGYIKSQATLLKQNYATGVTNAQPKFLAAITKIIAFEQAGLPAIYSMPSGTQAAAKARMNAWSDYMHSGKGTLGA